MTERPVYVGSVKVSPFAVRGIGLIRKYYDTEYDSCKQIVKGKTTTSRKGLEGSQSFLSSDGLLRVLARA